MKQVPFIAIIIFFINAMKIVCFQFKPLAKSINDEHNLHLNNQSASRDDSEKNVEERKDSPRALADQETGFPHYFDSVNFIPLDGKRIFPFFNNLGSSIQQNYSDLLIYPYTILHPNGTSATGGIFDINKRINTPLIPNWSLKEVVYSKAKPLFLINIGIVSKKTMVEDQELELFAEEGQYCSYFTGFNFIYKKCYRYQSEYEEQKAKGSIDPFIIYLDEESLVNMLLNEDGSNKIDLLFIPDFYTGKIEEAKSYFTPIVVEAINKFLENKGNLVVAGRSPILLEDIGFIEPNTYNTSYYLRSSAHNFNVTLKTCGNIDFTPPDFLVESSQETDKRFLKNVICNGIDTSGITVSSYIMNKESINDFETLISYENFHNDLKYINPFDGKYFDIEEDAVETPYLITKPLKQGRLFIFNSNPLYQFYQGPLFQNLFLYSCLKDANLLSKLIMTDDKPIPSGENNVELRVDINFTNHSPGELTADIHVFLPKYYMMYIDYDKASCAPDASLINKGDFDTEKNNLNASSHLICHYDAVKPNQLIYLSLKIGFSSIATNEFATNINILQTLAYYVDKKTPLNKQFILPPVVKAKTAKAASLKGTVDCSGSTFYPLPGRGKEQKTTIKIQNKYTTEAKSIEYIDVIPLITPIIDGNSYSSMGRAMSFMSDYYKQKGFKVPFNTIGDSDFLDMLFLNNRNVRLVPDYDQPVRVETETRTTDKYGPVESLGPNKKLSIGNINYSTLIDDPNTILKQKFIGKKSNDPDETQRLMCFVDDTSKAAQREILFARIDIHFNKSLGYKPTGITNNHVISIDKDYSKDIKWGSFNQDGLIPTHFVNALFDNKDNIVINGTNAEELKKVTNDITATHYLIPVQLKDIESIDQLKDFTRGTDGSGYHNDYPCIKFIKAHSISFSFKVKNQNSQGGKLILHLPKGITMGSSDPIKEGKLSFSSDKIAFTNTFYDPDQNTIESFFKSGLLALENSNIVINIESLSLHQSFAVKVETFEMKYDLSVKENNHEVYTNAFNYDLQAAYSNFFSLPAIEMRIFTKTILGNQIKSPYTEYSLYIQELHHRTVYGSMKSNHVSEPGAQLMASSFSLITKIGATSEHLINYISGKSTAIPSAASSSRIEWTDLWNRNWAQPLATIFSESSSDGNSKFNDKFSIATTFELTQENGKKRILKWRPEDEVELRVKIKISNLYNKYFEPTICNKIQIPFKTGDYPSNRIYDDAPIDLEHTSTDDKTQLTLGHRLDYGKCYMNPLSIMTGRSITSGDYTELSTVKLCSPYTDIPTFEKCIEEMDSKLKVSSLATNYSPDVEAYYPKGYITQSMWNMEKKGYDDHTVFKGYKYHHDNNLPSIDQDIDVPQNIIGFSILKPFDYLISYDKTLSLSTFPNNKGWWSDNLQNRDNTLLAGQPDSYQVSEQQSSPLTEDKWVHYSQLNSLTAGERSKSEYMCLFNQKRLKTVAKQTKYAYSSNVLQNNIVPIIQNPKNDINCADTPQYSDKNISQYDNKVVTQSDVDWIYFSSNIRAQAKETINIVLKLKGVNYMEGIFKILDGIEFNYWNPLSEPNTFTKIKSDSTVIEGISSGIELKQETWPSTCEVAPLCMFVNLLTVTDKSERFREYELDYYYNSYGFGDVSTGVTVGGMNGSSCKVYPGNVSFIEITITNNAGYDFNLLKNGMEYPGSENGSELMKNDVSNIQNPTKINFITFNIPSALKNFIEIEPSDLLSNLTHQEISFNHHNPTSIKDGTKAHFYFKLTIKETFAVKEMGMMKEIPVILNAQYFDHIIGKDDLLPSLHDYNLTFPPIKFGVPHSASKYAGKVYHVLEYNTGLYYNFDIFNFDLYMFATLTNETLVEYLKNETIRHKYNIKEFTKPFDGIVANTRPIRYTCRPTVQITVDEMSGAKVHCHFEQTAKAFPIKQTNGEPDLNKIFVFHVFCLPRKLGMVKAIQPLKFSYFDYRGQNRTLQMPSSQFIKVSGPLIKMKVNHTLVSQIKEGQIFEYRDDLIYPSDSGIMKVQLFFENIGDAFAYNMSISLYFGREISINKTLIDPIINYNVIHNVTGQTFIYISTNKTFPYGEGFYFELYLAFEPFVKARLLAEEEPTDKEPIIDTERIIIDKVEVGLTFENVPEKPKGTFDITDRYTIPYPDGGKSKRREIFVNITNVGTFENPKMNILPETKYFKYEEEDYSFSLFRRIISSEIGETAWEKVGEKDTNDTFEDIPLTNTSIDYVIEYRVEAYFTQTKNYAASGVNSLSTNRKIIDDAVEKDSSLSLILVCTLSSVVLLIIIVIIACVFYRLSKRKKEEEKQNKAKPPVNNYDKNVPVEICDIKKSTFNNNDTDSDLSPAKLKREPQFKQPTFIRIRRRNSTHGTTSIQNFISEH